MKSTKRTEVHPVDREVIDGKDWDDGTEYANDMKKTAQSMAPRPPPARTTARPAEKADNEGAYDPARSRPRWPRPWRRAWPRGLQASPLRADSDGYRQADDGATQLLRQALTAADESDSSSFSGSSSAPMGLHARSAVVRRQVQGRDGSRSRRSTSMTR